MNFTKAMKQQFFLEKKEHGGKGDCSVKCVSIVCDVPYMVAHKALQQEGRILGKGATYFQIRQAITALGYDLEDVEVEAKTMTTLDRDRQVQKGYFYALLRGHIASVVNGKIEDWSQGRRHKIIEVCKVTPAVSRKERKQRIKAIMGA